MTKKINWICIAAALMAMLIMLSACAGGPGGKGSGANPILIGHEVSLTGSAALWGESESNALDMEIERINAAGGVLGRPLKVIRYDNKADQTEAVNVANRLIGDKVVAIVGPAQSGTTIAATSVTEPAKIVMVATSATNTKVTVDEDGKLHPYNFRTAFIDPYQGKVAARFALDDLKATKAAILRDIGSDYSQGLSEIFKDNFTAGGGQIVSDEAFRSEELDYRAQLGKIKESGAELVFMPTAQKEGGLAMKQARELGLECSFLGTDNWASIELVELGGAATEGCFFVNIASQEDPVLKDWVTEYKEKWKKDPVMPNPVLAVDAIRMIVAAIEATQSTDGTKMAEYMSTMKGVPVLTGILNVDPETHNPLGKPAVIETVKDGKFVFYKGIPSA